MKEKIKKISLIILYIFIWIIFIPSFILSVLILLFSLFQGERYGFEELAIFILSILSAYLLRRQIIAFSPIRWIWQQRLILAILFVGLGLFYWFQIRPAQIYSKCNRQAQENAMETTKNRAEDSDYYKKMAEKGFYLTRDYDSAYTRCLRMKGVGR